MRKTSTLPPKVGRRLVAKALEPFRQWNWVPGLVVELNMPAQNHPDSIAERKRVELLERHLDGTFGAIDAESHARASASAISSAKVFSSSLSLKPSTSACRWALRRMSRTPLKQAMARNVSSNTTQKACSRNRQDSGLVMPYTDSGQNSPRVR